MVGLELVVLLGVALLACRVAAVRYRVAAPVLQLGAGVLLGFVPALRAVELPPEVVLLLFLPVLLYWEAMTSSLQEIRRNLRGIVLMSTALVVLTAGAVAAAVHAMGVPWGPAWVLGGAVAPTDATAVGVVARLLPRRNLMVLKAESLVNDGTALVVYGLAVGVTVGEDRVGVLHVSWLFALSYAGGVAAGVLTAWLGVVVRRRVSDPLAANLVFLLIPFSGYLLAESVGASGVLAVVAAGLIISQTSPTVGSAEARRQIVASWSLGTFLLNGALFVLVGIEAQGAVRGLTATSVARALAMVVVVAVVLSGTRIAFLFASAYLIRAVDRRPQQRERRVSGRARIVSGLAGFRGAVSLAAALAVPATLDSGEPFPDRDLIVFVTFGVIVVTLLHGLVLPGVVRWARLPDPAADGAEERLAHETLLRTALAALPEAAAEAGADGELVDRYRRELEGALADLAAADGADGAAPGAFERDPRDTALHLALIARKRAALVRLRAERRIDDTVLVSLETRLDIEELRLTHPEAVD
ncbi:MULTISPECIES: Na+/H+ antiporter [Kitasatospora]|uniref:Putative sodium/proton antiporter n=1 Tax=Kitasatospora setae (strain ATCC 33774 / DSM 43861 / JCM 3304 / KCC A-0304 / NBRC 14216 / KM-6054) TaxID=452652 RepID=E4N1T8_KITSK|nr:Na+/H+ antiporter [Kitasatospora setae]BAJ32122.1 putative sodium/proton antiporter [Kitasatospora setae KM-6054]